jgi:hypothetical protein
MAESIRVPVITPPYLQEVARQFRAQNLVADEVAPVRDAAFESGKYSVFGRDDLYQVDTTYSHGSIPNAITSRESEDTFNTELRVIRHQLLRKDTDPARPNGPKRERRITAKVTLATLIGREARVAALFTNTANYVAGAVLVKAGGAEWDNVGVINTLQPITDIDGRIQLVMANASVTRADIDVVMADTVFDKAIRYNTAIRDFYKYTQAGVTTPELIAAFLGVRRVLLARGRFAGTGPENTANDISTGITTSSLWGENVWIGVSDAQDMDMLTFARQFSYTRETGGQEIQIRRYAAADEGQRADWIEGAEQRDVKLTANFAGALITNTLT